MTRRMSSTELQLPRTRTDCRGLTASRGFGAWAELITDESCRQPVVILTTLVGPVAGSNGLGLITSSSPSASVASSSPHPLRRLCSAMLLLSARPFFLSSSASSTFAHALLNMLVHFALARSIRRREWSCDHCASVFTFLGFQVALLATTTTSSPLPHLHLHTLQLAASTCFFGFGMMLHDQPRISWKFSFWSSNWYGLRCVSGLLRFKSSAFVVCCCVVSVVWCRQQYYWHSFCLRSLVFFSRSICLHIELADKYVRNTWAQQMGWTQQINTH